MCWQVKPNVLLHSDPPLLSLYLFMLGILPSLFIAAQTNGRPVHIYSKGWYHFFWCRGGIWMKIIDVAFLELMFLFFYVKRIKLKLCEYFEMFSSISHCGASSSLRCDILGRKYNWRRLRMAFLDNFPPKWMNLGVADGIYWALFQNAISIAVRQ